MYNQCRNCSISTIFLRDCCYFLMGVLPHQVGVLPREWGNTPTLDFCLDRLIHRDWQCKICNGCSFR